jgi:hypothetical protein
MGLAANAASPRFPASSNFRMSSNTAKSSSSGQNRISEPPPAANPRHDAPAAFPNTSRIRFHVVIFLIAFSIVVSRRPDALFHAQFYAEDGTQFYAAAYHFGLRSIAIAYGGYLHAVPRLAALLAQLVPFALAPLVMNLVGITFQVLPVNVFLSSRFSNIAFPIRLLGSFIYLALPNSAEIDATVTNVQSHLILLCCLLLLARPAASKAARAFDATLLVLTSLSSPMSLLLVPFAAFVWSKRRDPASLRAFVFLAPGTIIEALTLVFNWHSRHLSHNGASVSRFVAIVGRQVFVSALLGVKTQSRIMQWHSIHWIEWSATLLGLVVLLYTLRYAAAELRIFLLFAVGVLTLALISPGAGVPDRPQWDWLCVPGIGSRYYFFPMLAFLSSLIWMACHKPAPKALRGVALAMLLLLPIGVWQDWSYPRFINYHFKQYAAEFERAPSGAEVTIPINPNWSMQLTKH